MLAVQAAPCLGSFSKATLDHCPSLAGVPPTNLAVGPSP